MTSLSNISPFSTVTGSIATLDESELFGPLRTQPSVDNLMASFTKEPLSDQRTTRNSHQLAVDHDPLLPMSNDALPQNKSPPNTPIQGEAPVALVNPTTPLSQESDDDHDELDLFRKTSPPPIEPSRSSRRTADFSATSENTEIRENVVDAHDLSLPAESQEATHETDSSTKVALSDSVDITELLEANPKEFSPPEDDMMVDSPAKIDSQSLTSEAPISKQPKEDKAESPVPKNTLDHQRFQQPQSFVPVVAAPARRVVVIPVPVFTSPLEPEFNFGDSLHVPSPLPTPVDQARHQFKPNYTLPPSRYLQPDCSRKSKTAKQRKREKEREKNEGRKDNDWAPMGVNRWAAAINANPVWKKVARASKCLSTREWVVRRSLAAISYFKWSSDCHVRTAFNSSNRPS